VSINGANRLGSNSLPELLVFGARAGRAAAEYVASAGAPPASIDAQARDEERRIEDLWDSVPAKDSVADLREAMQTTMEDAAGIFRTGPGLAKGADQLRELQDKALRIGIQGTSRSFSTELVAALELANMLDVAECMLASGLQREESRGAHQRTDFPARDDERFLVHQMVRRGADGTPRIDTAPVTITRWPPAERVYGR